MSLPFRKVRRPDWPLGQFLPGKSACVVSAVVASISSILERSFRKHRIGGENEICKTWYKRIELFCEGLLSRRGCGARSALGMATAWPRAKSDSRGKWTGKIGFRFLSRLEHGRTLRGQHG